MVSKRLDLRRVRENLISTTIQSELLRLQSFTDPLTEVYNRRSLDDMAGRFISHARRSKRPLTFLLIDVDRFKEVNTRFGHLGGDMVLAEIATLLKSSTRGSDAVVRYGGDEFLIILAVLRLSRDADDILLEVYVVPAAVRHFLLFANARHQIKFEKHFLFLITSREEFFEVVIFVALGLLLDEFRPVTFLRQFLNSVRLQERQQVLESVVAGAVG
jgi:GGDEF domain-containing protein